MDGNNFNNFLGNFPLSRDSLIILVRGFTMSFPILLFDFVIYYIFGVIFIDRCKLVSIICSFFRYDLKLGFPLVFNLFVRCGLIFICGLMLV